MANIFQPVTRLTGGVLPFNIGVGELVNPVKNQGLNLDDTGAIYAITNGTINHYSNGLPFNLHGRLVVGNGVVSYVDNLIPYLATGSIALGGEGTHYAQSLAFDADGALATSAVPPTVWEQFLTSLGEVFQTSASEDFLVEE